ncbi:CUB and zona pellucida-like domain-containing protein 1 [Polyodon spathula]|uniref:CUB and zona pellucida-like domain-containing protein 1 n=1 Tax=Polyodon spathula TaxID=7913 RepID=UPI001B7F452B|nr:CUB and zona pellucida-like domain-containing protein 1 [Polyodon spathula]
MGLLVVLLCCSLVSGVFASHLQGGIMTFTPKGRNPDGTIRVDFRYKESFRNGCHREFYWYCSQGNCGSIEHFEYGTIDSDPLGVSWCQAEGYMSRRISSDKPFDLQDTSCCWIYNSNSASSWLLLTHVDLGTRSDTGFPNRSPVTTILPIIRVPGNCPSAYTLMAHDPDGDRVRCRYGVASYHECFSCYQHSNFHIDESTCTLSFNGAAHGSTLVFELVLEDSPRQYITLRYGDGTTSTRNPFNLTQTTTSFPASSQYYYTLSKIPLQFVVQVDPAVPSCNFGEYRPQFLNPSPPHGIYVNASVGHEFQIPLRAVATRDRISDIKMSGPLNITKTLKNYDSNTGVIDVMITWTPTENDFGEHIPICFIAETASGYQSEMRCVIAVVVNKIGEADIECTDTTMTLYISKSSVRGLHENHLRLNDPTCSVTSNGSHIIASVSLNSCGTKLEETENDLIFRNEITSFDNPHDIITRKHQIEIPFICKFPKKSRLSTSFKAHKSAYLFTEAGFGSFTYLFEFYDSSAFSRMINPNSYPIEVQLQDMIYMDIQVQTSLSTTQLFVESCRATPNDNPNDPIYYDIISNGCIEDETTVVYLNNQTDFRFGLEAFNFIGNYEQVYISCTVILCVAGDPSNRCAQGCTNGTSIGHHHRKRSLASQSQRHFISQGPLRFARSSSGSPGSNLNLNLNILVVAVAFIAAVSLVCGVLIYKAKMANIVKYETVPSADF